MKSFRRLFWLIALGSFSLTSLAYEFVSRPDAKPPKPIPAAWANVSETFRASLKFPDWPMPTNLTAWENHDRAATRETLLDILGDLPPRPDPAKVRVTAREDKGHYTVEHFEFFNGADTMVPGVLFVPKSARVQPAPAVLVLHHFASNKDEAMGLVPSPWPNYNDSIGVELVKRGYVVAAIDAYFHGDRIGHGVMATTNASQQESDLFKLDLWFGRSLFGMMLRDQQCVLDYLQTRPEVRTNEIGVTGMSMGCMEANWLAAMDDRIKVVTGVACFTRYEQLLMHGGLKNHSFYVYVPGMLRHFDTDALAALIAPRPHLELCGDTDALEPLDGIKLLDAKTSAFYQLYGQPEKYQCAVYQDTGHNYLPPMKTRVLDWLQKYLPVNPR